MHNIYTKARRKFGTDGNYSTVSVLEGDGENQQRSAAPISRPHQPTLSIMPSPTVVRAAQASSRVVGVHKVTEFFPSSWYSTLINPTRNTLFNPLASGNASADSSPSTPLARMASRSTRSSAIQHRAPSTRCSTTTPSHSPRPTSPTTRTGNATRAVRIRGSA